MTPVVQLVMALLGLVLDYVGQEKAQQLLSEEAKRRANAKADAVAAARQLADKL